ncbi:MAG: hypothetical protein U0939_13670 [Pirellulales bacterium]
MPRIRLVGGPLDGCSVDLIDDPRCGDVVPLSMSTASSPVYRVIRSDEARFEPQPPPSDAPHNELPSPRRLDDGEKGRG